MAVSAARLNISATSNLKSRDHEKHPDDINVWSCGDVNGSESRIDFPAGLPRQLSLLGNNP